METGVQTRDPRSRAPESEHLGSGASDSDLRSSVWGLGLKYGIRNVVPEFQSLGLRILGSGVQDLRSWTWDPGFRIQDLESKIPNLK